MKLKKRVCVLSLAGINDSRAQRTIRSMSDDVMIDYFFVSSPHIKINKTIFDENVNLYPLELETDNSISNKLIKHSFFFLESKFLINEVEKTSQQYDIIFAHDLLTSYAAYKLAEKHNAKIIYDVHDLYIETLNQLFPRNVSFQKQIFFTAARNTMKISGTAWEKFFIKRVDLTLTVNEYLKNYLESKYNIKNCMVTPNYPEFVEVGKSEKLREDLNLDKDKKIILYHGTLNDGRNLELLVESAKYLNEDKILVIIGEGHLQNKLKKIADDGGFNEKIKFLGFVNYENLLSYISSADLGVMLIEHINVSKKHASPNKLTEYMAAGIPILISDSPESRKIIENADCGFVKDFENPADLAAFIDKIFLQDNLDQLGENGRKAFREIYNWNIYENKFVEKFRKLLN